MTGNRPECKVGSVHGEVDKVHEGKHAWVDVMETARTEGREGPGIDGGIVGRL